MLSDGAAFAFYIIAFVTIISAVMVVTMRNIFHSALFLILCLFSVAGVFILCDADFLAGVQVLVYVGGIAVLMIFAIMLTAGITNMHIKQHNEQMPMGALIAFCFLLVVLGGVSKTMSVRGGFPLAINPSVEANTTHALGKLLLTNFVLPFELVSVLLLAALIGAVVLAKKDGK